MRGSSEDLRGRGAGEKVAPLVTQNFLFWIIFSVPMAKPVKCCWWSAAPLKMHFLSQGLTRSCKVLQGLALSYKVLQSFVGSEDLSLGMSSSCEDQRKTEIGLKCCDASTHLKSQKSWVKIWALSFVLFSDKSFCSWRLYGVHVQFKMW